MSKHTNLREFQQALSKRIQESTTDSVATSRLAVQVGDQNWLIDLTEISEVIAPPPCVAVPLTKPWFLGVTNIRGRLYTVVDLPAYARLGTTRIQSSNRLLLTHPRFTTPASLLIDQALGLRNIDQMQTEPVTEHPDWETQCYRDQQGQLWHGIDVASLVSHPDFLAVSLH